MDVDSFFFGVMLGFAGGGLFGLYWMLFRLKRSK